MRTRHRFRDGFTLLEVIVALVVLGTGILGLAASAALVSRLIGDGSRLTLAATVATARLEHLQSLPCGIIAAGAGVTRDVEERWTAASMGPPGQPSALEVQLSVTYRLRGHQSGDPARTQQFTGA